MINTMKNTFECRCGATAESDKKKPRGWKEMDGAIVCGKCFAERYVIRAVCFPVIGPINPEEKEDFYKSLRSSWEMTTALANWMITEMAKADHVRTPDSPPKMPKAPQFYFYPMARKLFPALTTQTVVALENMVRSKYMKSRFEVIWLRRSSLPLFRYPQPIPLPPTCYRTRWLSDTEKHPVLSVRLCGRWFDIKLKGGPHFRPQHRDFEDLGEGRAIPCEASIYEKGDTLMAKLVMRTPRKTAQVDKDKAVMVATDPKSLMVGTISGNELWRFNADHVRRWIQEHDKRLMRLREDAKLYRRAGETSDPASFREMLVRKQRNRLDSITHQAAAAAVNYALKVRACVLNYDDSERGFVTQFPWFEMKAKLEQKCAAHGLIFHHVASAAEPGSPSEGARVLVST